MRTTIVLEDALYTKLKESVPQRKISNFINQIIKEKIADAEKKVIANKMKEGYLNTSKDRKELVKDWDGILAEGWE
jgi:metal-responsive CopG/Arc/MetJ family transcriptional regulator